MASEFTDPVSDAVGFLLDQEAPLSDLMSVIIALDLVLSSRNCIDSEDMPGAKFVAAFTTNAWLRSGGIGEKPSSGR